MLGPLFLRESGTGRTLVRAALDQGRARSAVGTLPGLLFTIARDDATTDHWSNAAADYGEGIGLARELGQTTMLALLLAGLSWLEARQGHADACRAHAEEALALCARSPVSIARVWAEFALGELELVSGDVPAAVERLSGLLDLLAELDIGDPDVSPAPELVEALPAQRPDRGGGRAGGPVRGRRRGEGAALGAGPGGPAARAAVRLGRAGRPVRRGVRAARADAGRVRVGPDPAGLRRPAAAGPAPLGRPRAAARGAGLLRPARGPAVGRPRRGRAGGDRRDRCPSRRRRAGGADPARAADRAAAGRGPDHPARPPRRCSSARRRSSTTCGTSTPSSASPPGRSWPPASPTAPEVGPTPPVRLRDGVSDHRTGAGLQGSRAARGVLVRGARLEGARPGRQRERSRSDRRAAATAGSRCWC